MLRLRERFGDELRVVFVKDVAGTIGLGWLDGPAAPFQQAA